jgi:glutathione S-transferase
MSLVALVILLSLVEFMVLGGMVGYARGKYGVKAPATTGNDMFERHFRVHYNTLENLIIFIPAIWLFADYVSEQWAAVAGGVFILGRIVYAIGYVREPRKREYGSLLSTAAILVLVFGALYGVVREMMY